jgi:broad specificity phosphatase PhoE
MRKFYLIRHGETDWNIKLARLQGHTDIPLNEKGIRQSQALAQLTTPLEISRVISSDLQRAMQTAQHMTKNQGPHETTPELREVHLGVGEGHTWDEVTTLLGGDFRTLWSSNSDENLDMRFPQGESRREVIERMKKCLVSYLEKYPNDTLAFVTHGFVIRSLVYHLMRFEKKFFVPNCAILPFAYDEKNLIYQGPDEIEALLQPRIED